MRARLCTILVAVLVSAVSCNAPEATAPATSQKKADVSADIPSVAEPALEAQATDEEVHKFYEGRRWQAAWSPKSEQSLKRALDTRARHGLDRVTFMPNKSAPSPAAREVALTQAALNFASALSRGLSDPTKLYDVYSIPRPDGDQVAGLEQAVDRGDVGAWLESLAPPTEEYAALSREYLKQRKTATQSDGKKIQRGDLIKAGDRDPRVSQLAAALRDNGYLPAPQTPASVADNDLYTPAIALAVKNFQSDFGIAEDGVLGPGTLAVLNAGPGERARAIAVAMERLRWLPRIPPATRIDVNTATAELQYFREGREVDRREVVVGQPGKETPQLSAPFFRLVANPTWTVPKSIQTTEMAGKGSAYFRRNKLAWRAGRIVQMSGPGNSLGLVKFDMQDDQAIYLHDTPAKNLFARNQRQLSHGCVRVRDALGFAQMIAGQEGLSDRWSEAQASGKESFVLLASPIPVRLFYQTVTADAAGNVLYRTDPYGWDDPVAKELGFDQGGGGRLRNLLDDIGP